MKNKNIKIDNALHELNDNYIKFSRGLLDDKRLNPYDKNVYLELLNQVWRKNAFVTLERIAEWCGISKPTASKAIHHLQQTDWLTVDVMYNRENDTPLKQVFYTLHTLSKSSSLYALIAEKQAVQDNFNKEYGIVDSLSVKEFSTEEIEQTFAEIGAFAVANYDSDVQLTQAEKEHISALAIAKGLFASRMEYLLEGVRQYKERTGVVMTDEKISFFIPKLNRINKTEKQINSFIQKVQNAE